MSSERGESKFPASAHYHFSDGITGNHKLPRKVGKRCTKIALFSYLSNLEPIEFSEMVALSTKESASNPRVVHVARSRNPLKIFSPIIFFIKIYVVYLRQTHWVLNELGRDNSMDSKILLNPLFK